MSAANLVGVRLLVRLFRVEGKCFTLYAGLMVKLHPNLLPYFAIVHALMDISVLTVYLTL